MGLPKYLITTDERFIPRHKSISIVSIQSMDVRAGSGRLLGNLLDHASQEPSSVAAEEKYRKDPSFMFECTDGYEESRVIYGQAVMTTIYSGRHFREDRAHDSWRATCDERLVSLTNDVSEPMSERYERRLVLWIAVGRIRWMIRRMAFYIADEFAEMRRGDAPYLILVIVCVSSRLKDVRDRDSDTDSDSDLRRYSRRLSAHMWCSSYGEMSGFYK
nr:hypothetical protein Iba_chr10aCG13890 [Ipomoea batatas]